MEKIRVFLVDDHDLIVLGITKILGKYDEVQVLGTANNGEEALKRIRELKPNIVILDIDIPKISGLEITETLQKEFGEEIKVILHSSFVDEENIVRGFELGAQGYVPKKFEPTELLEAIKTVHSGKRFIKGEVSEIFMESFYKERTKKEALEEVKRTLTKREMEVLKLITQGLTNQQMADEMYISVRTVEVHKSNIMRKLKIDNTAELVKYAIKHNIISL